MVRGIYPLVACVSNQGYQRIDDAEVARRFEEAIERRRELGGAAGGSLR
jgi:proteasome beta subunit